MQKINRIIILFIFSVLFLLIYNCASAQAGIAVSNVPLEGRRYKDIGSAETSVYWVSFDIGFIAFPFRVPPVDRAVQTLLSKKGGNALVNIRYSTDRIIIGFITIHRFHIKADVVKVEDFHK